ncbi:hypothetical protein TI39_contig4345g00003 [Zymoseptoria brevis]|uniref:Uncharacterized protein n=1 Tax=Zymoseptoria brevis TaxID=1047168 RepID=A0A0F4G7B7_9PEZI|nr:hypothetical protein TI39_contig4345g00003 [Zymoseptoria brevis]
MARTRPRYDATEPRRRSPVDFREEIRQLLQQDAPGKDAENDAALPRPRQRASREPEKALLLFRTWWWEQASVLDTDTQYWAGSNVIHQLAAGDAERMEQLLDEDAKAGWQKAAKTLARTMGWEKHSKLRIYAMFGDMLNSRKFLDTLRELILMLKSRKAALCALRAAARERQSGLRKQRNVNPSKEWVAKDAQVALEECKAGLHDHDNEEEDNEEEPIQGESGKDKEADDDEEESIQGGSGEDKEADDDEEESIQGESGEDKEADDDEEESTLAGHGDRENNDQEDASREIEQARTRPLGSKDEPSFGLDEVTEDSALDEVREDSALDLDQPEPGPTDSAPTTPVLRPKSTTSAPYSGTNPRTQPRTASSTSTADRASFDSDSPNMNLKRRPDGMPYNQRHTKRRLRQSLQEAYTATANACAPLNPDLEAWLIAVSAAEGDDEDVLKVLHRDLNDTTAISFAKRTCVIWSNQGGRAAAAYVDRRREIPVCRTFIPDASALDVEAFDIIARELDAEPESLDITITYPGSWSLVAILTCLCTHRLVPDTTTAYPPIWQHALEMLVAPRGDADLDTDSAITCVADVLPSASTVVSSSPETTYPQPKGRVTSLYIRQIREQTEAVRKGLEDKAAVAEALLLDATLIASMASVAIDRHGPCNEPDTDKSHRHEQIDSCKAYLASQRRLATRSPSDKSIKEEIGRLELRLKDLEAEPVKISQNRLQVVQRHMQRLAGFIAARSSEYDGEISSLAI